MQQVDPQILRGLVSNRSLQTLNLDEMSLGASHAPLLASILRTTNLLELSLRKNNLNGDAMKELFSVPTTRLETLLLSHNPIGDDGAKYIRPTMQKLCLAHTEMWSTGVQTLLRNLRDTPIKYINLDGVVDDDPALVLDLLQHHVHLEYVIDGMPRLMREDDAWKQVDWYLRLNKAGRRVLRSPGTALLPHLLANKKADADVLFYFLQQLPGATASASVKETRGECIVHAKT
jgi:hypothetical protein